MNNNDEGCINKQKMHVGGGGGRIGPKYSFYGQPIKCWSEKTYYILGLY